MTTLYSGRRLVSRIVGAGAVALALTGGLAACASKSGSGGSSGKGVPYSAKFSWGQFHLSSSVASKLKSKAPLNFVLSYQILNEPGAPAQLTAGMKEAAAAIKSKYGVTVHTKLIGPPQTDPPTQISQIQSLVAANQVDCAGVEPVTPGAFVNVINRAIQQGIPMMTVNTDSPQSDRLAYYGADDASDMKSPLQMGKIAGDQTVQWAKAHKVDLNGKQVALISGDTTAAWAQARMTGWINTVKAAFPTVKVVGTPTNALTTGYIPSDILPKASAFMTGHPGVSFYFDSDWGAEEIGQLIGRNRLKGKVATIGYNIDPGYIQDLQKGLIVATIDQRYDLQAKNFVLGCADFLLGKQTPSTYNFVKPSIWTPTNVADALKVYSKIPNSGV